MVRPMEQGIRFGLRPVVSGNVEEEGNPVFSSLPQKGDLILAEYQSGDPAILFRPLRFSFSLL